MTTTDRHSWDIPTVGGDADQWGTILNNLIDDDIATHTWITRTTTTNHTAANYETVLGDASGGALTVTLPAPGNDVMVTVKKTDATANAVTIATPGSETIDGASNKTITAQYGALTITSDGTNYFIV